MRNLFQPFEVIDYHSFVISSANNWKIASVTVKGSFSRLHNMSKDSMFAKDRNTESGGNLHKPFPPVQVHFALR